MWKPLLGPLTELEYIDHDRRQDRASKRIIIDLVRRVDLPFDVQTVDEYLNSHDELMDDDLLLFQEDESAEEERKEQKLDEAKILIETYLKLIGKVEDINDMVDIVCNSDEDMRLKLQANLKSCFKFCYDLVDERKKKQKQPTITCFFKE